MRGFVSSRGLPVILFILLIFAIGPSAHAQPYDLNITATSLKLANPGELVTHVFTVHNQGSSSDTYNLTLDLPNNWTSLPIPDQLNVAAGSSKPVFANINVPRNAKAEKYDIQLTAESTGDPSLVLSKTTYIQVKSVPGFELAWEIEPSSIGPGATVDGRIKLTNTGNLPDRYMIEAVVPEGWSYSLGEERVQLMQGQSRILVISFTAPETADSGDSYRLEVRVTSEHERDVEEAITSTGRLRPPPPEKVSKSLYPTWDVFTSTSMNQEGDPQFYVSGRGDIPSLGDVSTNLSFSVDGVEGAGLRVMREEWGFALNNSSISGSYLGVSGFPLFIGELDDTTTRFIFTEKNKGVSLEKEGDYWDIRAVLGSKYSENQGDYIAFNELQGTYEFSDGVVFDGLITTAETQTSSGTIVEAGLDLGSEKTDIYTSFVKVYPGFPNQSPRLGAGVNVSYEEEDEFSSSFDWGYSRTRVGATPSYYYSTEHDFDVYTSVDLGENLDSNFSLGFTWRKSDDVPASNNLFSNSFSGSLSGGDLLTWSFGTSVNRTHDKVSDTIVNTHSVDASLSVDIGQSEHSVGLSLTRTEGPSSTTTSNTFTLSSDFSEFPLSPTFSLSRSDADTILYANFSKDSVQGLALNISFSVSLVQQDSVSLSLSTSFPGPFRFCGPTKGQIKGYLFVDENRNGRKDPGERGVKDGILALDGGKAVSGQDGRFVFQPVRPGKYRLDIEKIASGLKPRVGLPRTLEVKAGEIREISVPLRPRSWVMGTVYNDKNQNGSRERGEQGMSGIVFSIRGEGVSRQIRSGSNGRFIADLSPGTYRIELQKSSLPERYEATTPSEVTVTAKDYGRTEVSFGVYQKPKPTVITFGPPTAKFSYSPAKPVVGEEITLDASSSSAIQTEIEKYEWEITHGETVIMREGKRVQVNLDQVGAWEISLIVMDKNGLKGKTVKTIQVTPTGELS